MTNTILRVSPIRYIGAKVRPHATPWMLLYCVDLVLAKKNKKYSKVRLPPWESRRTGHGLLRTPPVAGIHAAACPGRGELTARASPGWRHWVPGTSGAALEIRVVMSHDDNPEEVQYSFDAAVSTSQCFRQRALTFAENMCLSNSCSTR